MPIVAKFIVVISPVSYGQIVVHQSKLNDVAKRDFGIVDKKRVQRRLNQCSSHTFDFHQRPGLSVGDAVGL